jgi:hypothetical protein
MRREVLDAIRRLERENAAYASALALLATAALRYDEGKVEAAVDLLNRGERAFVDCDMMLYAAVAGYRRGRIIGGDAGQVLVLSAVQTMTAEGIVRPERVAALMAPGPWRNA